MNVASIDDTCMNKGMHQEKTHELVCGNNSYRHIYQEQLHEAEKKQLLIQVWGNRKQVASNNWIN